MASKQIVHTTINGDEYELLIDPRQSLLELLRDAAGLTGAKEGCNNGNCGACNVTLDGVLVNSCLVLGVEAEGRTIGTVEGLAHAQAASRNGGNGATANGGGAIANGGGAIATLHPLQQKFLEHAALQCGICTPGILVAAKALLDRNPDPTEAEVRYWLAGNLCRCTGYDKIVRAVLDAADA